MICCPWAYGSSLKLKQLYSHYLRHIWGFWVTCGVKMMSLCHGWGSQPTQTASHIHIKHIKSVWEHWYAVHGYMTVSSNSYTQLYPVIPAILGSDFVVLGHLWSQNDVIMPLLRLTANLKCFPHPYHRFRKCLSTLICCPWACGSSLKQLYPHYLGQILWFWVTCGVKRMV